MKRVPKKIEPSMFLSLMCLESQKGSPSYNDIASRFEAVHQISPSKQAIWKRTNESCVLFFQAVLAKIIESKLTKFEMEKLKINSNFKRVLIQDSTIIKLPFNLHEIFSGASNASTTVCNARIQGIYDLLSGKFIAFSIDSYIKNDVSAAPELKLQKGDLVLRDRGYFSYNEMERHIDEGAEFINRYKCKNIILHSISHKVIDLSKLLKKKKNIDMEVCLNNTPKTKVRFIATPVSEEVANNRRMKSKREMKGKNPSAELLRQMSWSIFITTIPENKADIKKIFIIYSLRWRIEIIFKTWKSYMQFDKVHNVSEHQLRALLIARFIVIVICAKNIFNPLYHKINKKYKRIISFMKLQKYLMINPEKIIELLSLKNSNVNSQKVKRLYEALIRYCTYDKRVRPNFHEIVLKALN